ncbi:hypothetical protein BT69DRAFT_749876 [Atractiella rhizophila]|nr:hypothetical protein BT69DRAFT_749876 [Atractiella rhizophila]
MELNDIPVPNEVLINIIGHIHHSYTFESPVDIYARGYHRRTHTLLSPLCLVHRRWTDVVRSWMFSSLTIGFDWTLNSPELGKQRREAEFSKMSLVLEMNPEWCKWVTQIELNVPQGMGAVTSRLLYAVQGSIKHLALLWYRDAEIEFPPFRQLSTLHVGSVEESALQLFFLPGAPPSTLRKLELRTPSFSSEEVQLILSMSLRTLRITHRQGAIPEELDASDSVLYQSLQSLSLGSRHFPLLLPACDTLRFLQLYIKTPIVVPPLPSFGDNLKPTFPLRSLVFALPRISNR